MKRCYVCKETKPLSEFYKNRDKKDGHADECGICSKEMNIKWKEDNLEKHKEQRKVSDRKYNQNNKSKKTIE